MDPVEFRKYVSTSITVTTIELERAAAPTTEMADAIIATMVACSGFATTVLTEATMAAILESGYKPDGMAKVGPVIGVLGDIANRLQPEEVQAMVLHEEGHVVLGHLEGFDKVADAAIASSLDCSKQNVVKNLENLQASVQLHREMEADAYAASIMGAAVVRTAIISVIGATCSLVAEKMAEKGNMDFDRTAMFDQSMADPIITTRLNALNI